MLINLAGLLVIVGIVMLVVGVLIARQYTLRAKLLTAFLVIVLLSFSSLVWISSYYMGESLTKSANGMLVSAGRNNARLVDEYNLSRIRSVSLEANLPAITRFLSSSNELVERKKIIEILNILESKQNGRVNSYAILSADGINLVDSNVQNIGRDESVNDYYRKVVEKKSSYRSPVVFDMITDAAMYYYSAPVMDVSGVLRGVLRVQHNAEVLSDLMTRSRGAAGTGSFAILLDENNLRLVHGRRDDLQYTFATGSERPVGSVLNYGGLSVESSPVLYESSEWIKRVHEARESNGLMQAQFYGIGTDVYSAAVLKLESLPWTMIYAQSKESVLTPVQKQMQSSLLVALVVSLIVVLVVFVATQYLLGPVKRLTSVVNRIGGGNLDVEAKVEADDEVGGLAKAFNNMTQNIIELVANLENEVIQHKLTADNLSKISQAVEQSPVSVMITDIDGKAEYVNPEFTRVTGYLSDEIIGYDMKTLNSDLTPSYQFNKMWSALKMGRSWTGEVYSRKKNGDLYWENVSISPIKGGNDVTTHLLVIKEDITLRKDYEERLLYQASYDSLTDLPNRSLAYDRLQQAIANATREEKHIAVLYLDFDHFKNINDTLGHEAGDRFLVRMAERLRACVRDIDTVARLGGDEFLVMLTEVGGDKHVDENAYTQSIREKVEAILKEVSRTCTVEEMDFAVTVSAGVAIFPKDGDDPHSLLKNSDTAMYRSKRKGRDTYEMFSSEMSDSLVKKVEIDSKLRRALEEERFTLVYQALMNPQTESIVGAEALLRWEDEEVGIISPDVFIPLAEESGLIVDIGSWVLNRACADIRQIKKENPDREMYVAVNLSGREFRGKDIIKRVSDTLGAHGLSGDSLELEITERLLMKDLPDVVATLTRFKEMDIRLSIDDFGTGYSSLSYLKRFPFDVLKIDQAFVKDIGQDEDATALCEAIISMAHSLGLNLIAEGVETKEQYDFLNNRGTEVIQGYYISEPVDIEGFRKLVSSEIEYG